MLCRELKLFSEAVVAIDGSKFKAVNNRQRNYTPGKIERRERELEESIQCYIGVLRGHATAVGLVHAPGGCGMTGQFGGRSPRSCQQFATAVGANTLEDGVGA
jgi:hypothetical protein